MCENESTLAIAIAPWSPMGDTQTGPHTDKTCAQTDPPIRHVYSTDRQHAERLGDAEEKPLHYTAAVHGEQCAYSVPPSSRMVPLPLVKSPPWHTKLVMTRWKEEPLK